jgi:hypothetical protein
LLVPGEAVNPNTCKKFKSNYLKKDVIYSFITYLLRYVRFCMFNNS